MSRQAIKGHETRHEQGDKHKPDHADNNRRASTKGANEAWQAQIDAAKAKKTETRVQDKQSRLTLSPEQVKAKVGDLKKELNKVKSPMFFWDSPKPDVDASKVHKLLDGLTKADRQAIDKAFRESNKAQAGVLDTLAKKIGKNSGGYAQVEALMKRQDNKTDHAGSVHTELAKVSENGKQKDNPLEALRNGQNPLDDEKDRSQSEERLLNTIYRVGNELKDLKDTIKNDYHKSDGKTLQDDIKNNKYLSPEGKAAAQIMLQENWDKDPNKVAQLRQLGLNSHRLDIFEKAMQVSTPQARDLFRKGGGLDQIKRAFGDTDAGAKARDLALIGKQGLEKALADQTWKLSGTDHEQIEYALTNADPKEKSLFKEGHDLLKQGDISKKRTAHEQEAIDYYRRVHDKLGLACTFNDGQRKTWESKLLSTDKACKDASNKPVDKTFHENQETVIDDLFHNKEKATAKLNALMHMSPEEQKRYTENTSKDKTGKTYRQYMDGLVNTLREGPERELGKSILGKVARGEDPSKLDKYQQVLHDNIFGADRATTIQHIEDALEAPDARYRIAKGLTPKDKAIKSVIDSELENLKKSAGYIGDKTMDGKRQLLDSLYKTGHIPPELSALAGLNKKTWLEGILNTPADTRAQLADTNTYKSWDTNQTQANLIGNASKKQQDFIQDLLKRNPPVHSLNDKNVTADDRMRAFALGIGPSQQELENELKGMDATQRASMASKYFNKYKHDIADDILPKISSDQQRHFQDLLSRTDVTLGQQAINAREDHDKHKSPVDIVTNAFSAAEGKAENELDKIDDFLHKNGKNLSKTDEIKLKKALDEFHKAEKEFVESKEKAAEAFVNATMTLGTVVGSIVQPELAPLALAKLGLAGGAYRLAAMKAIQGDDFDGSAGNMTKHVFQGGLDTVLGMYSPGAKLGASKSAVQATLDDAAKVAGNFKPGLNTALKNQMDDLTAREVLMGSQKVKQGIEQAIRDNVLDGTTEKQVQEAIEAYAKQLKKNTALEVVSKEVQQAVNNIGTGAVSAGAAQLATDIAFPPEGGLTPKELFDRCAQAGAEGTVGAAAFHFGIKGLGAAGKAAKGTIGKVVDAVGNDKYFVKDGTVIQHANGSRTLTGKDKYWLEKGDTIVPPERAATAPTTDAQVISNYMANNGELNRPIPDGYTDIGSKHKMNADGTISTPRGATTYDATNDRTFRQFKESAKTHITRFKNEHPFASLDEQMEELINWEKQKLGAQTSEQEEVYTSFMLQNGSKRVPIGQLIKYGYLGCSERAHLLKILADENIEQGYARIVRGDGTGNKTSTHVWVQTGENKSTTIWDSNNTNHKLEKSTTGNKYHAESAIPGRENGITESQVSPGQPVKDRPGWHYASDQPKNSKFVSIVNGQGQKLIVPKEQFHRLLPPTATLVKDMPHTKKGTEEANLIAELNSKLKELNDLYKDQHLHTIGATEKDFTTIQKKTNEANIALNRFKTDSSAYRRQCEKIKSLNDELQAMLNGKPIAAKPKEPVLTPQEQQLETRAKEISRKLDSETQKYANVDAKTDLQKHFTDTELNEFVQHLHQKRLLEQILAGQASPQLLKHFIESANERLLKELRENLLKKGSLPTQDWNTLRDCEDSLHNFFKGNLERIKRLTENNHSDANTGAVLDQLADEDRIWQRIHAAKGELLESAVNTQHRPLTAKEKLLSKTVSAERQKRIRELSNEIKGSNNANQAREVLAAKKNLLEELQIQNNEALEDAIMDFDRLLKEKETKPGLSYNDEMLLRYYRSEALQGYEHLKGLKGIRVQTKDERMLKETLKRVLKAHSDWAKDARIGLDEQLLEAIKSTDKLNLKCWKEQLTAADQMEHSRSLIVVEQRIKQLKQLEQLTETQQKELQYLSEYFSQGLEARISQYTDRPELLDALTGHVSPPTTAAGGVQNGVGAEDTASTAFSHLLQQGWQHNPTYTVPSNRPAAYGTPDNWIGIPAHSGSAADHSKGDYILINKVTGDYFVFDFTTSCDIAGGSTIATANDPNVTLKGKKEDIAPERKKFLLCTNDNWQGTNYAKGLARLEDIISKTIAREQPFNILDDPLPAALDISAYQQIEQMKQFQESLTQRGWNEWRKEIDKAINYVYRNALTSNQ